MASVTINPVSNYNLDNLLIAYPNVSTFYFEDGDYELTTKMMINKPGIRFIGISYNSSKVNIRQITPNESAIHVTSDNCSLAYISLHVTGTASCLVVQNSNWNNIENCKMYGDADFVVAFVGPSGTDSEIDKFLNGVFDMHNIFDNNIVYTLQTGNSILYSNQQYGSIRNNIVRGGKIHLSLTDNCMISNNYVQDSPIQGIYCSMPITNTCINLNRITKSQNSAIHMVLLPLYDSHKALIQNIDVSHNIIRDSAGMGLEINNVTNITVSHNDIKWAATHGIYILTSDHVNVRNNKIVKMQRGIIIDVDATLNTIEDNVFYSTLPFTSINAIFCEASSNNNTINNNTFKGTYQAEPFKDIGVDNTESGNTHNDHISFNDEILNLIL